jgi:predicted dehydrogenase
LRRDGGSATFLRVPYTGGSRRDALTKRVAVIGAAGFWGAFYMRAFASDPRCEIVAVADTASDRLRQVAEHYGVERRFASTQELLGSVLPDIAAVVLPVRHTPGAVTACAAAGVPVVGCEKPISASLADADRTVAYCRERRVSLSCGTALWEIPRLESICRWLRDGNLGELREASLPSGFNNQISGNGCVPLCWLRFLAGREAEWVEGWTTPPEAAIGDGDCNAYGRIGLPGGAVCHVPSPAEATTQAEGVALTMTRGRAWIARQGVAFVQGSGPTAGLVFPDFLGEPASDSFHGLLDSLIALCDQGGEAPCSGHDYRQALEIAIAFKLSAAEGHRRVTLPLEDRSLVLNPVPYRMEGGDVAGWDSIGLTPPRILPDTPNTRRAKGTG